MVPASGLDLADLVHLPSILRGGEVPLSGGAAEGGPVHPCVGVDIPLVVTGLARCLLVGGGLLGPGLRRLRTLIWVLSSGLERPAPLCPKGPVVNWDLIPATKLLSLKGRAPSNLCFGVVPSPLTCLASSLYLIKQALFLTPT